MFLLDYSFASMYNKLGKGRFTTQACEVRIIINTGRNKMEKTLSYILEIYELDSEFCHSRFQQETPFPSLSR